MGNSFEDGILVSPVVGDGGKEGDEECVLIFFFPAKITLSNAEYSRSIQGHTLKPSSPDARSGIGKGQCQKKM